MTLPAVFRKRSGGLGADLHAHLGLQELQFVQHLQDEDGNLARTVRTVSLQPSEVDLCEVVVGSAFRRRDADFRRCGGVVDLDPEAGQQFLRLFTGHRSLGHVLLVEGGQVLVEVPGAHGVPSVHLGDGPEVDEPVHLQCFPEVARGVGWDPAAGFGDLEQLGLAGRVGFLGGHLFGQSGVALGEEDHRVARDVHCGQFLELLGGVGIVEIVQFRLAFGDLPLEVQHALAVDSSVEGRVPGGPLLHELGVEAGFVEGLPLLGDQGEGLVAHAAPPPVGDDLLRVEVDVLRGDGIARHLSGVEDLQVLPRMAVQLGKGGHGAGGRAALADDQFVRANEDRLPLAEVLEVQGPHDGSRNLACVFLVELGHEESPFDGDGRVGFKAFLPEPGDAFVHVFTLL